MLLYKNISKQKRGKIRTEFKIVEKKNTLKKISDWIEKQYQKYKGLFRIIEFIKFLTDIYKLIHGI